MMRGYPIRCSGAAILILCGTAYLGGQAPTKPSAAVSALPAAQPTGQAAVAPPAAVHRVEVNYGGGKLAVDASNGSLNEILRDISQKTGIKITGSVAEDRVFGHYGPASPAAVLDALLEGTGTNVLLVDSTGGGDGNGAKNRAGGGSELILTSRRGGVTPPNPNAAAAQASENDDNGQYVPPVRPFQPPVPNGRSIGFAPNADGSPNASGDAGDGGGPKTPQQIYDQLQRVSQQQRQAAAPPQQ